MTDDPGFEDYYRDYTLWDNIDQGELARAEDDLPEDRDIEAVAAAAMKRKNEQTHDFRQKLFVTVRASLIATLVGSAVIMITYMISQWGEIQAAVMISFNAAVVVNTIGLAYIVANYLFPRGGSD